MHPFTAPASHPAGPFAGSNGAVASPAPSSFVSANMRTCHCNSETRFSEVSSFPANSAANPSAAATRFACAVCAEVEEVSDEPLSRGLSSAKARSAVSARVVASAASRRALANATESTVSFDALAFVSTTRSRSATICSRDGGVPGPWVPSSGDPPNAHDHIEPSFSSVVSDVPVFPATRATADAKRFVISASVSKVATFDALPCSVSSLARAAFVKLAISISALATAARAAAASAFADRASASARSVAGLVFRASAISSAAAALCLA
mmetsp:Transcript_3870/g.14273  ORF Transcript_3870/g.14273 Transcript_3870/m.14273 type:complete len:268 (+) Transcript_3870:692-1495(+)